MKTFTASVCLAALALAGCAGHVHSLIPEESDGDLAYGTFLHEGPDGPLMVVEFAGKRFEGQGFAIERSQNLNELRRRYGSGRHYDKIESGLDADHYEYAAKPELRAADGSTLRCLMTWRQYAPPNGYCLTTDKTRIYFRFE